MKNRYSGIYDVYAVDGFVKQASVAAQKKKYKLDQESMVKILSEVN